MPATHRNRGRTTEDFLELVHAGYERRGIASCTRLYPPIRVLGFTPRGMLAFFEKGGPPDWHVQAGELSILLDAKEAKGQRWPFDNLEPHQAARFDRHVAQHANALAGLVIRLPDVGAAWWIPWPSIAGKWHAWSKRTGRAMAGGASLDVEDLDECGVRCRGVDWISAASSVACARQGA
jgi:penicillin-binding protein-related factor A (putative recombinase)